MKWREIQHVEASSVFEAAIRRSSNYLGLGAVFLDSVLYLAK